MAFIGFEQFSSTTTNVLGDALFVEPIYSDGDTELNNISKKLAKRDPTTKLKGLSELQSIILQKPDRVLRKFIPHWVHIYSRLSFDRDHRVREALSQIHLELTKKFPKAFFKRLHCVVGVWWISMFDPHEAVAKVSGTAFAELVGEQRNKVLSEMLEDLTSYVHEVLSMSVVSLVESRLCNKDEAEDVLVRIHVSALLSIAHIFQDGFVPENLMELLNQRVWRSLESGSPAVRRAAYSLVSSLCNQSCFAQQDKCVTPLAPVLFNCMSETHPRNVPLFWECLECFLRSSALSWHCWTHDALFSQALGEARIPPAQFPLLIRQMRSVHTQSKKPKSELRFYRDLFESLFRGIRAVKEPKQSALYSVGSSEAFLLVVKSFSPNPNATAATEEVIDEDMKNIVVLGTKSFLRIISMFLSGKGVQGHAEFTSTLLPPLVQHIVHLANTTVFESIFSDVWDSFEEFLFCANSVVGVQRLITLVQSILELLQPSKSMNARLLFKKCVIEAKSRCESAGDFSYFLEFIAGVAKPLNSLGHVNLFEEEGADLIDACVRTLPSMKNLHLVFQVSALAVLEATEHSVSQGLNLWRGILDGCEKDLGMLSGALDAITPMGEVFHHIEVDSLVLECLGEESPLSEVQLKFLTSSLGHKSQGLSWPLLSTATLRSITSRLIEKECCEKSIWGLSLYLRVCNSGGYAPHLQDALKAEVEELLVLLLQGALFTSVRVDGADVWKSNVLHLASLCSPSERSAFFEKVALGLRSQATTSSSFLTCQAVLTSVQWAQLLDYMHALPESLFPTQTVLLRTAGVLDHVLWQEIIDSCENGNWSQNKMLWECTAAFLSRCDMAVLLKMTEPALLWQWFMVAAHQPGNAISVSSSAFSLVNLCSSDLAIDTARQNIINYDCLDHLAQLLTIGGETEMLEKMVIFGADLLTKHLDSNYSSFFTLLQVNYGILMFLQQCDGSHVEELIELLHIDESLEENIRSTDRSENAKLDRLIIAFRVITRYLCAKFDSTSQFPMPLFLSTSYDHWTHQLEASISSCSVDSVAMAVLCVLFDAKASLFIDQDAPHLFFYQIVATLSCDNISSHSLKWLSLSYREHGLESMEKLGALIINSLSFEVESLPTLFARVLSAQTLIQKHISSEYVSILLESLVPLLPMLLVSDEGHFTYFKVMQRVCCDAVMELLLSCISYIKSSNIERVTIQLNPELLLSLANILQGEARSCEKLCAFHVLELSIGVMPCLEAGSVMAAAEDDELVATSIWKVLFDFPDNGDASTPALHHLLSWLLLTEHLEIQRRMADKQNFARLTQWVEKLESFPLMLSSCSRSYQQFQLVNRNRIPGRALFNEFATIEQKLLDWTDEDTQTKFWIGGFVLHQLVCLLPSLTRKWWSTSCPKTLCAVLQNFIETEVSQSLAKREVETIENAPQSDLFSIHGSSVSREISAKYVQDECVLELVIRLPITYPLRNVEVDCRKRLGVSEPRWRRWVLQIVTLLSTQDGSVLDAVLLWKSNVDKEFEGLEPCPICYCILHPKTLVMPSLECHTCNNKFHPACLYKWFNSSHKSKCPLCQQPINI